MQIRKENLTHGFSPRLIDLDLEGVHILLYFTPSTYFT